VELDPLSQHCARLTENGKTPVLYALFSEGIGWRACDKFLASIRFKPGGKLMDLGLLSQALKILLPSKDQITMIVLLRDFRLPGFI
jgi:hypothetical protein